MSLQNNFPAKTALFQLAFRPLILAGTLLSIATMSWWGFFWFQPFNWQPHGGPIWWHGHEMIFGFGFAIAAGFLLTAVQSWTGVRGLQGKPLVFLAITWLIPRLLIAFGSGMPAELIAAIDLVFPGLVTVAMAYPVIKVQQWRNLMFIPILAVFTLLNASSHWGVITAQPEIAIYSLHSAIMLFVLLIAILGGRVIPGFTANSTGYDKAQPKRWLEWVSIGSILLLGVITYIGLPNIPRPLVAMLCGIAALAHSWRFLRWGFQYCWRTPLLWSLQLAYLFIPLGFLILTLQSMGLSANNSAAMHSFTVGAMGGMILAMISRIVLGHTGRRLELPRWIVSAYVLVMSAAVFRVLTPLVFPNLASWGIAIAALLWILAYGIFCIRYGPMLLKPRVDGKPG